MSWIEFAPREYARASTRYASKLSDRKWVLILPVAVGGEASRRAVSKRGIAIWTTIYLR